MDVELAVVGQVVVDDQRHLRRGSESAGSEERGKQGSPLRGSFAAQKCCCHAAALQFHCTSGARHPSAGSCSWHLRAPPLQPRRALRKAGPTCLLHIQPARPHVGGDEHTRGTLQRSNSSKSTATLLSSASCPCTTTASQSPHEPSSSSVLPHQPPPPSARAPCGTPP